MNFSIFIVNYNADEHVQNLIKSFSIAVNKSKSSFISIHIIDNSTKNSHQIENFQHDLQKLFKNVNVHYDGSNKGYFGGLHIAQSMVNQQTNCVIYCNPDLIVEPDFFITLENTRKEINADIIAPTIICKNEGFNQNPLYLKRIRKRKLLFLKFIFSNNFIYFAHTALSDIYKTLKTKVSTPKNFKSYSCDIYALHGSMFIFLNTQFFRNLPDYPCFLFGEELFVAEEALKNKIITKFVPDIKITDIRHASISKMSTTNLREYSYKSVKYILKKYFN